MNIKTLKTKFSSQLNGLYPNEEINSFFNIFSEKYLGLSRLEMALNKDLEITDNQHLIFKKVISKLQKYEPIQYLVGETQFYGLPFVVSEKVLIPRPETEELVNWILTDLKNQQPITILDIGTGSGCIAITLAKKKSNAKLTALDISEEALQIAKQNANINKTNIHFVKGNILDFKHIDWNMDATNIQFNVIVSNPPYVREQEKKAMQPNVLNFEPHLALYVSNENPLLFYKKIAQFGKNHLTNGGILYFEINEYLHDEMLEMLAKYGYSNLELKKDLFGKYRMIKCTYYEKIK
ncbi:MAG: peptide chain release factor N(5)-glutamine methyltransferase [Flavobacteriales bacterium]